MFTTSSGQHVSLLEFLQRHLQGGMQRTVYIGTDSKNTTRTKFSTVLVAYTPGRGGSVLQRVTVERKIETLGERLWREAWLSVQLALEVSQLLPQQLDIEIHLDINHNERHKSYQHLHTIVGMVSGQGFAYRVKPDAWCATCIADRVVKRS